MTAPTCFISYSWDSDAHKDWVRIFASALVSNGVETRLDQWDVYPGMDLTTYMESCVRKSDFALLICTPAFAQKADAGKGGVGYEKAIVTGEIFEGSASQKKFVPILRSGDARTSLPAYLKSRVYLDFRNDAKLQVNLEQLLRHMYASPLYTRPALGPNPNFSVSIAKDSLSKNDSKDNNQQSPIPVGKMLQRWTRKIVEQLACWTALLVKPKAPTIPRQERQRQLPYTLLAVIRSHKAQSGVVTFLILGLIIFSWARIFNFGLSAVSVPTLHLGQTKTLNEYTGQWEILPICVTHVLDRDGWKLVSISLEFENKTSIYSSPNITTTGAQIITDQRGTYPVLTYEVQGSSSNPTGIKISTKIVFEGNLPPGARVKQQFGEPVISYAFAARIPQDAKIKTLVIPGYYGGIDLQKPDICSIQLENVKLVPETISRQPDAKHNGDKINVTLTAITSPFSGNVTLNRPMTLFSEDGTLGQLLDEPPDCITSLNLGPAQTQSFKMCGLVPLGTKDVNVVISGEPSQVYSVPGP